MTVGGTTFFGHPWGLATLFGTEMWERFSWYGLRAMVSTPQKFGFALVTVGLSFVVMAIAAGVALFMFTRRLRVLMAEHYHAEALPFR